eukprot:TRINITY_DN19933_c0_g1_i1.p1 TRINITY_DN19933_c0_g1~~TRINITY_DN19933_c0_g1_i1.p1  ORF type:complete len:127 (+),score=9.01 TRINITY_DN19933_c0_g1_i1:126-506(+)
MDPFVNYTCRIYWHFHVALCLSYLFFEIVTCIKQNLYSMKELYREEAKEIPQKIQPPRKGRGKSYTIKGDNDAPKAKQGKREPNSYSNHFPPIMYDVIESQAPELRKERSPGGFSLLREKQLLQST